MVTNYEVFKQSIKKYIQNSELDIGVVYYILKDIYKEIENLYYTTLNRESMEITKQQEKENNDVQKQAEE